jgi:hypothetical protein
MRRVNPKSVAIGSCTANQNNYVFGASASYCEGEISGAGIAFDSEEKKIVISNVECQKPIHIKSLKIDELILNESHLETRLERLEREIAGMRNDLKLLMDIPDSRERERS